MKKKVTAGVVFLLLLFLLCFPMEALSASQKGLKLWLESLMPALLPFMILTGILIHTEGITKIVHPIAPFFKVVFGLSPGGTYVFLLGLLCGYPMGAKLCADLYYSGKISRQEANYLLTFCNNPSPAFLVSYVCGICLEGKAKICTVLVILMTSNLVCMIIFRIYFSFEKEKNVFCICVESPSVSSEGYNIDMAIMNGFETITRLGGYILLFSVGAAGIRHFWPFSPKGKYVFLGFTELTTGLYGLADSPFSYELRFLLALCMSAFGGFCILAQTKSVLGKDLSFPLYASAKCINAVITALLILFFIY